MPNHSIMPPVASMASTPLPSESSQARDGLMVGLENTIMTVNLVKEVVPLEIAKGVLSTISGVLSIIRVSWMPVSITK